MKNIFLFTHSFPFSKVGEAFIGEELLIASELDLDLTIVPLYSSSYQKEVPAQINIDKTLSNRSVLVKVKVFFQMLVSPLFFRLFYEKKSIYSRRGNWFSAIKYVYGGLLIKDYLLTNVRSFPQDSIFYSFWFNYTVLGFALAKENDSRFNSFKFYSRAHRYDLYAEEVGVFIPYREKMLTVVNKVFSGSGDGVTFLTEKYPEFASKIELGRLGVLPINNIKNKNKKKNAEISLISCSTVVPVKRVSLIFNSIKQFCEDNPQLKVSWMHIGDGDEMELLKDLVLSCRLSNLLVDLPGYKLINELIDLLENNEYDAFINFSLSEGLPVTLMMAISAGIPLIATDAGGTKEIVTKETGFLLPLSFRQIEFSEAVMKCLKNQKLRESSLSFFQNNFSASKNYKDFYQKL